MTDLVTTPLNAAAIGDMVSILAAASLPISDLAEPGSLFWRFDGGALAGFGGIEGDGSDRLLRSLVVAPDRRGEGLGCAMLGLLEAQARELGVARLHLLTTTAARFFAASGYIAVDRASAPASIAASREFAALCPGSADYLVKAF